MKKLLVIIISLILSYQLFGAYLVNVPQTITQPDGATINCFVTGDEFYSWLHDSNNFTIVRNQNTGYYCYAMLVDNVLVASPYIVGVNDPVNSGLIPGINLSNQEIITRINFLSLKSTTQNRLLSKSNVAKSKSAQTQQTLNNIVVYIRFSDQDEFPASQSQYTSYFNGSGASDVSMYNYFNEISYGLSNITSTFYPNNNDTIIISYQDAHTRNYYRPESIVGDSGYCEVYPCYTEREYRENALIMNALNYVKSQIPVSLNLDGNNDGNVDNICFIVRGNVGGYTEWNKILWPHKGSLAPYTNYTINSKYVRDYNFQFELNLDVEVICHEMCHTLGAPDLYHYTNPYDMIPLGNWDIMCIGNTIPVSICAYTKYKYMGFINEIPIIASSGHYTLQPIISSTNNCYKIQSSNPNEYFVLEFRQKTGTFESNLPGTGLLIYRINNSVAYGNSQGPPDEVYLYRPNGTLTNNGNYTIANFNSANSRSIFNSLSNPNSFLSDGSIENFVIKNIIVSENNISFDIRLCSNTDITLSNTNMLPEVSNAVNTVQTAGSVIVKSTDKITLEAGQEIMLNNGFEVQQGGQLDVNIVTCGQ